MKMVNTVELKNRTNALLRQVGRGEAVIVTRRGKPVAALTRLTDADLEEFVLRYTSRVAADGGATAPGQPADRARGCRARSRTRARERSRGGSRTAGRPAGRSHARDPRPRPLPWPGGLEPGAAVWAGGAAGAA